MMRRTRMIPLLIVAFLIAVKVRLYDIWDQYNVPAYIGNSLGFRSGAYDNVPLMGEAGDKIIVMAKMEKENTDWVGERLPEYTPWSHLVSCKRSDIPQLAERNIHRRQCQRLLTHPCEQRPRSNGLSYLSH